MARNDDTNEEITRPFYIGVSLLMGLIAVVGFWPTYFGPLMRGTLAQPLLIHVHTAVFVGWLFLFLTQAVLAAVGHVVASTKDAPATC